MRECGGAAAEHHEEERSAVSDHLSLPFEMLSDADLELGDVLRLRAFTVGGRRLY